MEIQVRPFRESDIHDLVEILELNDQYGNPEVDGPEAMKRVATCNAAIFLVAEAEKKPCGFIRGVYDGSRALIHLLSVHPDYQNSGVGSILVDAISAEFLHQGAPTVSVTITEQSVAFWKKKGFRRVRVFLMLKNLK